MYIITREGHKCKVDTSNLPEDDSRWTLFRNRTVGLYGDGTYVGDAWVVQIQKNGIPNDVDLCDRKPVELEIIAELFYNHEPSKEELMWVASEYGIGTNDFINVLKGYKLYYGNDDEESNLSK